jgi:hypothetical protein
LDWRLGRVYFLAFLNPLRGQFADDEVIQQPRILRRPAGLPNRCAKQYLTMRHRVFDALGVTKDDDTSHR